MIEVIDLLDRGRDIPVEQKELSDAMNFYITTHIYLSIWTAFQGMRMELMGQFDPEKWEL